MQSLFFRLLRRTATLDEKRFISRLSPLVDIHFITQITFYFIYGPTNANVGKNNGTSGVKWLNEEKKLETLNTDDAASCND